MRENWYRDIWLLIVSVVDVVAIISALHAANQANHNVASIQNSRISITLDTCRDQNKRNDNTIARLNKIVNNIPDPHQRRLARRSVATTVSLIDAVVPKQNCEALVHSRFSKNDSQAQKKDKEGIK